MRALRYGAIAMALLLAGAGAAEACEGKNVLFEDQFNELDPTWGGLPAEEMKVEDGRMIITTRADWMDWVPNTTAVYDDIDMCVDVTTVEAVDPETNYVGLIFWYADDRDFYTVEINAKGQASVWRRQRGRWLRQVDWTAASSLHAGDNATNQLRVVTVGKLASLYFNGEKFKDVKGQLPRDGQQIGVIAYSPKKGPATYAFDNVKITEPQ